MMNICDVIYMIMNEKLIGIKCRVNMKGKMSKLISNFLHYWQCIYILYTYNFKCTTFPLINFIPQITISRSFKDGIQSWHLKKTWSKTDFFLNTKKHKYIFKYLVQVLMNTIWPNLTATIFFKSSSNLKIEKCITINAYFTKHDATS